MRRLVVGAVLALTLVGCGGDPKADPSPTPSPPSSSSTTPAPPVMPDAAKANTKAGAVAFVKYYVQLINHAQATGDVAELATSEAPTCSSCEDGRKYLSQVYESGGHIDGGSLKIRVLDALPNQSIKGWTIDAKLRFGSQTVTQPSATPTVQHLSGGAVPVTVLVSRHADGWSVYEWTRAQ